MFIQHKVQQEKKNSHKKTSKAKLDLGIFTFEISSFNFLEKFWF